MRTSIFVAVAGAMLATVATTAEAQTANPPIVTKPLGAATASLVVPQSSVIVPADRGLKAHTNTRFYSVAGVAAKNGLTTLGAASPLVGPPFTGYGFETPGSLACLYGLVTAQAGCNPNTALKVPSTLGSRAIVIVDAYHYASAASDLQKFSTQFGLPAANLTVLYATSAGACNGPQPGVDYGWEGEEALDLQMAHAMAPKAKLYLVEAQTNADADLTGAVKCGNTTLTSNGGGEMSMSWGGEEFGGETAYDVNFATANVVYFASSGDDPSVEWPSASPKVVSVGGTTISRSAATFAFKRYATWPEAGTGPSTVYAMPSFQTGTPGLTGTMRATPDISAIANPDTGVWVYDSNAYYGYQWYVYGGTSVASPVVAAITNAHGSFKPSSLGELRAIYNAKKASPTAAFATTTYGFCGPYASNLPTDNWNWCLGVGTIKGSVTPLADAQ